MLFRGVFAPPEVRQLLSINWSSVCVLRVGGWRGGWGGIRGGFIISPRAPEWLEPAVAEHILYSRGQWASEGPHGPTINNVWYHVSTVLFVHRFRWREQRGNYQREQDHRKHLIQVVTIYRRCLSKRVIPLMFPYDCTAHFTAQDFDILKPTRSWLYSSFIHT